MVESRAWPDWIERPDGYGGAGYTPDYVPTRSVIKWAYINGLTAKAAIAALSARVPVLTKHGKDAPGLVRLPPSRAVEIRPEREGIVVASAGPAVLSVKVNFTNLPTVGSGSRPKRVQLWFRRPSQGDSLNATGQADLAVPQDDNPSFKAVHTYVTMIESAGDMVRAVGLHDGATTIEASLAQFCVLSLPTA